MKFDYIAVFRRVHTRRHNRNNIADIDWFNIELAVYAVLYIGE